MRLLIVVLFLITGIKSFSQSASIVVEKKPCGTNNGFKLFVSVKTRDSVLRSDGLYDLKGFEKLPDTIKLAIVDKLLAYENDTSRCCLRVSGYINNYMEGCRGEPKSVSFNMQIDALFMINRICFGSLTDFYSCHPVLYDSKTKREINSDYNRIRTVFLGYRTWYNDCIKNGKISAHFPFNNGRYVWYAGRKSME